MVANLRKEKGHDVLMDAAGDVLRRFPDASSNSSAADPSSSRCSRGPSARGIGAAFTFLGHRDDVAARLRAGRHLRPAVALRSVSQRRARSDGRRAAGRGVRRRRACSNWSTTARPGCWCRRAIRQALARRDLPPDGATRRARAQLGDAARDQASRRATRSTAWCAAFEDIYLTELTRRGVTAADEPECAAS